MNGKEIREIVEHIMNIESLILIGSEDAGFADLVDSFACDNGFLLIPMFSEDYELDATNVFIANHLHGIGEKFAINTGECADGIARAVYNDGYRKHDKEIYDFLSDIKERIDKL
ncbi:MAG: hypothetical protein ACYCSB_01335 [bacterium]|jgi:hypothetical protein